MELIQPDEDLTTMILDDFEEPSKPIEKRPPTPEIQSPPASPIMKPQKAPVEKSSLLMNKLEADYKKKTQKKTEKVKPRKVFSRDKIPDYDTMTREDQEEWRVLFKGLYMALASDHPRYDIHYPGDSESLLRIHLLYTEYLKQIYSRSCADDYKNVLFFIVMVIEVFAVRYLKLPIDGYAKNQMQNYSKYQNLLIKMGAENFESGESTQPAWMQILMMGISQLVLFGCVKFVSGFLPGSEQFIQALGNSAVDQFINFDQENAKPQSQQNSNPGLFETVTKLASDNNIFGNLMNMMSKPETTKTENPKPQPGKISI